MCHVLEDWHQKGACLWIILSKCCFKDFTGSPVVKTSPSNARGFPGGSDCKESACDAGDPGSTTRLGRSPGERNSNPLQYSCLEYSIDRRAWWARVHGVSKSQTQLSDEQQLPMQGAWVQSLGRGLRSHMPNGQKTTTQNRSSIVTNSIKTLKMVHIRGEKYCFRDEVGMGEEMGIKLCRPSAPHLTHSLVLSPTNVLVLPRLP